MATLFDGIKSRPDGHDIARYQMKRFNIEPWFDIIKLIHAENTEDGSTPLAATLATSDGSEIHVELHGMGRIAFCPWTSGLKEQYQQTYENAVEMHSASGHDVRVLEFLAAFSKFQKEQIDAEHADYPRSSITPSGKTGSKFYPAVKVLRAGNKTNAKIRKPIPSRKKRSTTPIRSKPFEGRLDRRSHWTASGNLKLYGASAEVSLEVAH